ncbi:bifunctional [glutamine synthetase] adenylyltransferase/[glutamine synthetase]-adenylyl-L-tyrosine phosphorylase [Sphingomonas sp. BN140010]|uniref:Bifunctional [glutamine synthetase] adenylyltransferase/[glutamine synthetase]-adenylyl-L-tyrosine phosphorylase n=1 Tax=Sphingomonas arvum TaxID=2992113 RepID=A0ABT3JH21_9SPHN|nr:bifunctional [glutamine synthetase] adenylyltransferase/[glutamine synthetase]-adenylyl-L-tyrosine phosphorylase [Sphingomonas sp. BN140010]MCW3798358.1 bifunctional [glutamine synthetase] adenylyltransferase/[glutamine synthetase]-adenylyl-L-tyrosine phosphorylase [Sphingomonas sp. BN140010]
MGLHSAQSLRDSALARAHRHSPFLREASAKCPDVTERFLADGSDAAVAAAFAVDAADLGERLRRQRLRLALAVALGDLAGEFSLEQVTGHLSNFADSAIDAALRQAVVERAGDQPFAGLTVLALGKLGSRELNYSSDVDLILLFDPATLPRRSRDEPGEAAVRYGRRLIELLQHRNEHGYVVRVDLRLRPSPEVTPIALPIGAAISYYESSALPWERAAFIRARACAGDAELGREFLAAIQPFVWRRSLDFGVVDEIRAISTRIRDHYNQGQRFGPGYDLKRGRGGIREVEFFAQIQQLIHAGREPALRAPATLDALAALADSGKLLRSDAEAMALAYRRLRTAEHRVQMIADAQTHLLPAAPPALGQVAELHGLSGGEELIDWLAPSVTVVEQLFGALADDRGGRFSNDPTVLEEELRELGFPEPAIPARHVAGWRSGRARALRSTAAREAFEAMLPLLLTSIADAPDPAAALNRLADLIERLSSGVNLFRLIAARPELGTLLATVLSHAPTLAAQLGRRPELLDGLLDDSSFALPPSAGEFAARLRTGIAGLPYDKALDRARALIGERRFGLGVQLVSGHRDPIAVAEGYSDVAEGAVVALAEVAQADFEQAHGRMPSGELIVLALGRLGGRALTHASDLDLIFIYDGPPDARSDGAKPLSPADYYNRLARRIIAALSVPTAAGPLYELDTRLRPQGEQGMLAVSLDGFVAYQRNEAWTWEHMALCRARPLTGSAAMKERVAALIRDILGSRADPAKVRADAASMRAEMARHKPALGPLDIKLGSGGLVDLEFAVHTLQLTTGAGLDPRLEVALAELGRAGLVDAAQADADLRLLSRVLVCLRLLAPGEVKLTEPTQGLLARLCGQSDWPALVAAMDAARQRIAALWDRVKEGR